jgi:hypothetical protein
MSGINSGHHYLPTYQFSMSGINSGHHYLPAYQIVMISHNVEFCDIVVAILKMATGRNFSMSGMWVDNNILN